MLGFGLPVIVLLAIPVLLLVGGVKLGPDIARDHGWPLWQGVLLGLAAVLLLSVLGVVVLLVMRSVGRNVVSKREQDELNEFWLTAGPEHDAEVVKLFGSDL